MKQYYAVIDTNVVVSAMLKFDSVPGIILKLCLNGVIHPLTNASIIAEYREVLSRPKFHFDQETVQTFVDELVKISLFLNPQKTDVELPDPKDAVFYEVVMEGRKEEEAYLVTGNVKHFPNEPFIVTPKEMLEIIITDTL